jgi:hypothetical protein
MNWQHPLRRPACLSKNLEMILKQWNEEKRPVRNVD